MEWVTLQSQNLIFLYISNKDLLFECVYFLSSKQNPSDGGMPARFGRSTLVFTNYIN